jgi:hypothetical protein
MAWAELYGLVSVAIAFFCALQAQNSSQKADLIGELDTKKNILEKTKTFFWLALALYALITATGGLAIATQGDATTGTTNTLYTYFNYTENASIYNASGSFNGSITTLKPLLLYTNVTTNQTTGASAAAAANSDSNLVLLLNLVHILTALFMLGAIISLGTLLFEAFKVKNLKDGL